MGNVTEADTRRAIGANIKRLREAHEPFWSQERLAMETCRAAGVPAAPLGRKEISRYETGKRAPREWLPFIAQALGVSVEELLPPDAPAEPPLPTLAEYLPDDDPLAPLRDPAGRRIGMAEVRDLGQRVHGLRLADDVMAGGDLIRPALRELRRAVRLYRRGTHSGHVSRQLLVQIGELAQIAGWIASDAGQLADAERIYRLGISAAREAGDSTLVGNVAGALAYQYSNSGRETDGVVLAQVALAESGADAPAEARALALDRLAWAHTQVGDVQGVMRALGEASEALVPRQERDRAGYLYWVNAEELRIMESRCFTELRRPLRAVPLLREVLAGYDATRTREMALYLSWLVMALADANEPEEAAATARRMISLAADVSSRRTGERTRIVLRRLGDFVAVPEVAELLADQERATG
ncbi:helix-turn-helix domain-containing protein [Streptomyces triticirhizae]|uniref:XRE family transcriptional regulator n=1 Tax=Streptomyces triticirhizae TaxID=2483353 RepID=A0A3M2LY24_9ACTN|nr:helix-turn-helix transcriptional regulator [Streptomyces triticirhizae]RMI40945.1 XRE family transcriptional regulator [Streptomyces triticirhizae]